MGSAIKDFFSGLTEPRESNKRHQLLDIITIALCAVICGADTWEEIEEFGHAKRGWFQTFLELPHGIPSPDTFARVFASMDPHEFQEAFLGWVKALQAVTKGQVVAIDGKTIRRSSNRDASPVHMVSAWAQENRMVLGQVKTDEKSNEITAIPELLRVLDLEGCIVTIDAMGCQKTIAEKIIAKKADYVLGLKGNQGNLHDDVELFFQDCLASGFRDVPYDYHKTVDGDHGRIAIGPRPISSGCPRNISGRTSIPSLWYRENVSRAGRSVWRRATTSAASKVMREKLPKRYAGTGASRTASTGSWISPSGKMNPGSARTTHLRTSPSSDIWHSIYLKRKAHPKEASRQNGSKRAGTMTIWARSSTHDGIGCNGGVWVTNSCIVKAASEEISP
jgi:predicted transposase YbfD/YdcC